jgi:uncharacterized protein YcbX
MTSATVSEIWRFPIKSMQGERLEEAVVSEGGIVGDRGYALIDSESGKVVSAKSVRLYPGLLNCKAAYAEEPEPGQALPAVLIDMPDGEQVSSESGEVDRVLSDFFGRDVTLARQAPADYSIDQYHPDVEDADPRGHRDAEVEQKLGSAFFEEIGAPSPVPVGSFFDLFPISVMTTSTIDKMSELQPDSVFDVRRFRMNFIVQTAGDGFVENEWIDRSLSVGDSVQLGVAMPDPRCVMTTLEQGELPQDTNVLRTLVAHNRLPVAGAGGFPCAGVYATVPVPGLACIGDGVSLTGD